MEGEKIQYNFVLIPHRRRGRTHCFDAKREKRITTYFTAKLRGRGREKERRGEGGRKREIRREDIEKESERRRVPRKRKRKLENENKRERERERETETDRDRERSRATERREKLERLTVAGCTDLKDWQEPRR